MENAKTNEKPRILIIEDDEAARLSLKASLETENMFVEAVENGADAENMIKNSSFDVAIVDYRLPDVDGLTLIKKMKSIAADIMTLVVTAHSSIEIAVEAMRIGSYDYMSKPLDISNLINTIHKILNDKKELHNSRQMLSEMIERKDIDYISSDEKVSIITASDPNILAGKKSKSSFLKNIKRFFVGIKNYYWGA